MCHRDHLVLWLFFLLVSAPLFGQLSFEPAPNRLFYSDLSSSQAIGTGDFNSDGFVDVFRIGADHRLYVDVQSSTDSVFSGFSFQLPAATYTSLAAADINRDGFLDLAVGSTDSVLLVLTGRFDNSFDLQALSVGDASVQTVHWIDLNQDGLLDLFATNATGSNRTFRAESATTFVADTALFRAPPVDSLLVGGNQAARWTDIDQDGDIDLFLCRKATSDSVAGTGRNLLYLNQGDFSFVESGQALGLADTLDSWAAEFGDIDNDGDIDLYLINQNGPNALLRQDSSGFSDITSTALGTPLVGGQQCIWADFNRDRGLDLLVTGLSGGYRVYVFTSVGNYAEFTGALPFLQGNTATIGRLNKDAFLDVMAGIPPDINDQLALNRGNTNTQYLAFQLEGAQSNALGIGAQLRLYGPWGVQLREIHSSYSHGIFYAPEVVFGLGASTDVDSLEVLWPSGVRSRLLNLPVDTLITLSERSNCAGRASFTYSAVGLQHAFINTSTNGDTSRQWSFGDGQVSTERHPTYTYNAPGTYQVCLQSSGICGEFIRCDSIVVSCLPLQVGFTYEVNGLEVQFTNTGSGQERGTNLWTFGDDSTSTEINPVHVYDSAGLYEVCLQTADDCGTDIRCEMIAIDCPTILPGFSSTAGELTVSFVDTTQSASPIQQWLWEFGDGESSTVQQPVHDFPAPGTYEVCLTAFSDCDSARTCQMITVECLAPRVSFTTERNGLEVRFLPEVSGIVDSLQWSLGDGNMIQSDTAFTYTYAGPNEYTVCLLASSSCGDAQSCVSVVVGCTPPEAAFGIEIDRLTVLVTDSTIGAIDSYNYTFGDGSSSSEPNVSHTYVSPGTYTICQTVSSVCGVGQKCDTITLTCLPEQAIFTSQLVGQIAQFSNGNERATSFEWTFGDGNSSTEPDPEHKYDTTGDYEVCLIITEPCGRDTTCNTITVGCLLPNPSFSTQVDGRLLTATPLALPDSLSPMWSFGDGTTSTDSVPTHTYTQNGTYEVCLELTNDCGTDEFCQMVTIDCPTPTVDFDLITSGLTVDVVGVDTVDAAFLWTFGDGTTSTEASPRHTYAESGNYEVCLELTSQCDTTVACQTALLDCALPGASFNADVNGFTVSFTNTTSEGGAFRQWSFGDGTSGQSENPQHTYQQPGIYEVCLSEENSCGRDTFCQMLAIACTPISAGFSFVSTELDVAFMVSDSVDAEAQFSWTFGDDTTVVTMRNPTHEYTLPGSYEVCLTVENSCQEITSCQTIDVVCAPPSADFSFVRNQLEVRFADQSQNQPATFLWTFGDGSSSTETNPEHTFQEVGTYEVCLEVTSVCGRDSICRQIQVQCLPPETDFSYEINDLQVVFSDLSMLNPSSYQWDFGDGATSDQPAPTHDFSEPGTYIVCLTTSSICGSNQRCDTLGVSCPAPQAIFSVNQNRLQVELSDQSTGSPDSIFWDFGDGATSNEANPTHRYAAEGTYTICQTVSSACGETMRCQQLQVDCPLPSPAFEVDADFLNVTFISGGGESAQWTFGDGNSSTELNPTHTYSGPGIYQVCVEVTDECGSAEICQPLSVQCAPPQAGFSITRNGSILQLQDTSSGMISQRQWTFDDGSFSTLRNPIHQLPGDTTGFYEICLTVAGLCGETTTCESIMLDNVNSARMPEWATRLQIAPNPGTDVSRLTWEALPQSQLTVDLHSLDGRQLRRWQLTGRSGQLTLPVAELPAGLYLLKCRQNGEVAHLRLLVH